MTKKNGRADSLIRSLVHTSNWVEDSLQNGLEAYGWNRLPKSQSLIMANISDGVVRPSQLAKVLGISRQAIHRTLSEMISEGLVELYNDPSDKRAKIVRFSPKAIPIRDDALKLSAEMEQVLAKRIGKKNLANLLLALNMDWGMPIHHSKTST